MKLSLWCCLSILLWANSASAQSLKPEIPAPLQPGINQGTIDNFVGTHYWYFTGGPGQTHVHAQFTPMGLLGNSYRSQITVTLSDEGNTWHTPKVLSSDSKTVDYTFDGDLKTPTKILVSVAPPVGGLVRSGGSYQLQVTGAASFGQMSTTDPIIGTYNQMGGYSTLLGTCKFQSDGTIQSTSGTGGNWKLFDKSTQTYIINIDGQDRHSLQFMPGRGLCDDGGVIVFQQLR